MEELVPPVSLKALLVRRDRLLALAGTWRCPTDMRRLSMLFDASPRRMLLGEAVGNTITSSRGIAPGSAGAVFEMALRMYLSAANVRDEYHFLSNTPKCSDEALIPCLIEHTERCKMIFSSRMHVGIRCMC